MNKQNECIWKFFKKLRKSMREPESIQDGGLGLPQKYFTRWLSKKRVSGKIEMNYRYYDQGLRISDCLTLREIDSWDNNNPVFISSQTGTGKTYFVIDTLLRHVVKDNLKSGCQNRILFISNRIALNRQVKHEVADKILEVTGDATARRDIEENLTGTGIDQKTDFGVIQIVSYQGLTANLLNDNNYRYIVCDEAHFFTSDAAFNENTNSILARIVGLGRSAIRLYVSATPEISFEPIVRTEYRLRTAECLGIHYYDMHRDYAYLTPILLESQGELMRLFYSEAKQGQNSKWVIFFNNKEQGTHLKAEINDKLGEDLADTLSADKKNTPLFDAIIRERKIPCRYLISTGVINNGVSILDENVSTVAIIGIIDREEILQMIGRIRVTENQKLRLFIVLPQLDRTYNRLLEQLISVLSTDFMDDHRDLKEINAFVTRNVGLHDVTRFFHYEKNAIAGAYRYNEAAIVSIIAQMCFLRRFLSFQDKSRSLSIKGLAMQVQLYQAYFFKKFNQDWARAVVDLLEPPYENQERKQRIREQIHADNSLEELDEVFEKSFVFHETFSKVLYEMRETFYLQLLLQEIKSSMPTEAFNNMDPPKGTVAERARYFIDASKKYHDGYQLRFDLESLEYFYSCIKECEFFADDFNFNTIETEICRWFGKKQLGTVSNDIQRPQGEKDYQESLLEKSRITVDEVQKQGRTKQPKALDETFLSDHGLYAPTKNGKFQKIPPAERDLIEQLRVFQAEKGRSLIPYSLQGKKFGVFAYFGSSSRDRYYLLHEFEDLIQHGLIEENPSGEYIVQRTDPCKR